MHIEYAEQIQKFHYFHLYQTQDHNICATQALALVVYTWAENVAIYLFDNRI